MTFRKAGGLAAMILAGVMGAALPGCAPEVLPATQHAPSTAESVMLYQKAPKKYENLGMISVPVTPDMKWDQNGDSTPGFDAIKAKAATLGANGVLLDAPRDQWDVMVTAGYKNSWYQVPVRANPKMAVATAIFVVDN
jgi:hypothetical protein